MINCEICRKEIVLDNINKIIFIQKRCNKCAKVFKYYSKNVKINKVRIRVNVFYYLDYLQQFICEKLKSNHNECTVINNEGKNRVYCFQSLLKCDYLDHKKILIVFKRNELDCIIELLKTINLSKKVRIIQMFEVLK